MCNSKDERSPLPRICSIEELSWPGKVMGPFRARHLSDGVTDSLLTCILTIIRKLASHVRGYIKTVTHATTRTLIPRTPSLECTKLALVWWSPGQLF